MQKLKAVAERLTGPEIIDPRAAGIDAKWQGREGFRAQAVQGSELTAR
jgi:hypothetical protein